MLDFSLNSLLACWNSVFITSTKSSTLGESFIELIPCPDPYISFQTLAEASAKVWKDIYGSGQGINSIKDSPKVEDLVDVMKTEFQQAKREFSEKSNNY